MCRPCREREPIHRTTRVALQLMFANPLRFVGKNLKDYHHVIRPARIDDPFLGILHFLEKIS